MVVNDNIDRLRSAGIITPDAVLTPDEENALYSLTSTEVDAIISARNKLGTAFVNKHISPRPDFIF
jgi:hypothetical protein